MSGVYIGVDIGGTFTDLVLAEDGSDRLHNVKTLTTPANAQKPVPVIMQYGGGFGPPGAGRGTEVPAGPPYGPNAFNPPPPAGRGPIPGAPGAERSNAQR